MVLGAQELSSVGRQASSLLCSYVQLFKTNNKKTN